MDNSSKKKNIIKNITIAFLAVMLVLTFFSGTIMNYTLPEVSAQYAWGDSVMTRIRISGTVEAVENYQVMINEDRTISGVAVHQGDRVSAGDVLFVLEDAESAELTSALEQLTSLNNSYERWKIDNDLSYKNRKLNLDKLYERYEALLSSGGDIDALEQAKAALDAARERVAQLTAELSSLSLTEAQNAYESANSEYVAAKNAFDNADTVEKRLAAQSKTANESLSRYRETAACREVTDDDVRALKSDYQRLLAEYENYKLMNDMEDLINTYLTTKSAYERDRNNAEKKAAYQAALQALGGDSGTVISYENNIADKAQEIADAEKAASDYARYKSNLERYESNADDLAGRLEEAQSAKESAYDRLSRAESAMEQAKANYEEAKKNADGGAGKYSAAELEKKIKSVKSELDAANRELDAASERYDTAADQAEYSKQKDYDAALREAKEAYDSEKSSYDADKKKDGITESEMLAEISKQKKTVEQLKAVTLSSVITAKISGQISRVNCVPGQHVGAGTTLAEIEIVDKGYTLKSSVTNEQAKKIIIGSEAKPQYYWGGNLNAKVESITADPSNPSKYKIVTIAINGEVYPGDTITFNIGEKSVYYDCVVPNSAVREDSNGKYVLLVEAKNTPLGNRYTARRADISVTLSDDTKSAISGLESGSFVITNSTVPISAGTQVRLAEG